MRLEASQGVIQMGFLGVTAASTLVTALSLLGLEWAAPYLLAIGCVGVLVWAWAYVELGIYIRKNREKQDRGNNFAKPQNIIDNVLLARAIRAAETGGELSDTEREAIAGELRSGYRELRSGVEL